MPFSKTRQPRGYGTGTEVGVSVLKSTSPEDIVGCVGQNINKIAPRTTSAVAINERETSNGTFVAIEISPRPEASFQLKLWTTVFILCSMAGQGLLFGQMGPVLPDLQQITNSSLEEASWLFTGFGVGYIAGCLLAGIVIVRFNYRMVHFLCALGTAILTVALPWIRQIYVSVAVRIAQGILFGGQDIVLHAAIFAVWAQGSGPYFLMLYTVYAAGGIVSPLYSEPFMDHRPAITHGMAMDDGMEEGASNTTLVSACNTTSDGCDETNVHYAFMITAGIIVLAAIPFIVMYCFKSKDPANFTAPKETHEVTGTVRSPRLQYVLLVVMMLVSFISTSCIMMFPNFLTAFVTQQLSWSKQSAAALTSTFYGTYCLGNMIGIVVLKVSTTNKLIIASYALTVASLVGLLVGSMVELSVVIWVCVAVDGLAMAAIIPTIYTWVEENVTHVTGRIASGLLVSGSVGLIVEPILLGILMDNHSNMWFVYFTLGGIILCAVLYTLCCVSVIISKGFVQNNKVTAES